jgi:hypothetical protein
MVARFRPLIEVVIGRLRVHAVLNLVLTVQHSLLPRVDRECSGIRCDFPDAIANSDVGLVGIRICFDAIFTWPLDSEGLVGSIDFDVFVAVEPAHANIEDTFRQTDLHVAIVEIQKLKCSP